MPCGSTSLRMRKLAAWPTSNCGAKTHVLSRLKAPMVAKSVTVGHRESNFFQHKAKGNYLWKSILIAAMHRAFS